MKLKHYLLLLAACVASSSATATVTVRLARLYGVQSLPVDPALCPSGATCTYRDQSDNKYKLHRATNVVVEPGAEINAPGLHGTQQLGALSSTSSTQLVQRYQPVEGASPPWGCAYFEIDNLTDTRKDQVWSCGMNVGPSGNAVIPGESQVGWQLESHYEPGFPVDDRQTEIHWFMNPPSGPSDRVLSAKQVKSDGVSVLVSLADAGELGVPNTSGTYVWSSSGHSATISSGDSSHKVYVDNSQWILYAGGNPVMTSGGTDIQFSKVLHNTESSSQSLTVGSSGSATAPPAQPVGYLTIKLADDSSVKIPYYNP